MTPNVGQIDQKTLVAESSLLLQREIRSQIFDVYGENEIYDFLTSLGMTRVASKGWFFDAFLAEKIWRKIDTTGATVTGSGSATVTIAGLTGINAGYFAVGDTVQLPYTSAAKEALVTAYSAGGANITLKSTTGQNITLAAGNLLTKDGTAMEEGSGPNDPRRFGVSTYRNNMQIFSETWQITDVAAAQMVEVSFEGKSYYAQKTKIDALRRVMGDISKTFIAGQASATLFQDANPSLTGPKGYGVQTTRGLDATVELYGYTGNVTAPGVYTTDDIDDFADVMRAFKAQNENTVIGSHYALNPIDNWLFNLGSSGAQSIRLQDPSGRDVDFTAKRFTKGGYTYNFTPINMLGNTDAFAYVAAGSAMQEYATSLYVIPDGLVPTYDSAGVNMTMQNFCTIRYCQPDSSLFPGAKSVGENIYEYTDGGLFGKNTELIGLTRYVAQAGFDFHTPSKLGKYTMY